MVIQAIYFVVIARLLGPGGYGSFIGVTALVGVVAPYASLGAGSLLIRNVVRSPEAFREHWSGALTLTILGGLVGSIAVGWVGPHVLPRTISWHLIGFVLLADLVVCRIAELCSQAYQAVDRLGRMVVLQTLVNFSRLVAVVWLAVRGRSASAEQWGLAYLLSGTAAAVVCLLCVFQELGRPARPRIPSLRDVREGLAFSVVVSSTAVSNDIDKTMLARLGTLTDTGVYGSAYRIIDVAFSPIRALLASAYGSFFKRGSRGLLSAGAFAREIAPFALIYGVATAILLGVCGPLVQWALGARFHETAKVLVFLAPIPLLRCVQYMFGDALSGAGFPGRRGALQVLVAIGNVGLNLFAIPRLGWRGAALSSLATDGMLAALLAILFVATLRTERRAQARVAVAVPAGMPE